MARSFEQEFCCTESGLHVDMVRNTRGTDALEKPKAKGDQFDGLEKGGKPKGKKDHVRKKAWRPKTKTGCITCR